MVSRWTSVYLSVRPSVRQSYVRPSFRFSFPDKHPWIFTKLCIDIVEIWFGIANGQILSNFDGVSARDTIITGYYRLTFSHISSQKKIVDTL